VKLLNKFGLLEAAIDYAAENWWDFIIFELLMITKFMSRNLHDCITSIDGRQNV
jgi:hypothetical protein